MENLEHIADPRSTLDAAIDAARIADPSLETKDGRHFAFVPDGYALQNITDPEKLPSRINQSVTVDDRQSLSQYTNRFSDDRSIIMADYDAGTITAKLDWHQDNDHDLSPQARSHTATLKLRDSEEYKRWNQMEDEMHSQEKFALFIEENVSDVIDPDHSVLLEICRDLEATTDMKFRSGVRLENGDRTFHYEDETQIKNDLTVPTEIKLSIPLYLGEEPTEIRAKFRFRPTASGLLLGFRWHRVEYQRQATFTQMATAVSEETGRPIFFGRTN
jgi:uncharacterized protein YfdQ (DUF2303 family)